MPVTPLIPGQGGYARKVIDTAAERKRLLAHNAALAGALEYLIGECDEDMDDDYNPHSAPLALARAALKTHGPAATPETS